MNSENPNLILIKIITGIYLNRNLNEKNNRLDGLIEFIMEKIKLPLNNYGEGSEGEIANALRTTIDWLGRCASDVKVSVNDVTERVKLNCSFSSDYLDAIDNLLVLSDDEKENSDRVKAIASELEYAHQKIHLSTTISALNRQINFSGEHVDIKKTLDLLKSKVEELTTEVTVDQDGFAGEVDFTDLASIEECFEEAQESISTEGVLKTGLQGLNKLWGVNGYVRGFSYLYAARTHHYKTGMLLKHAEWMCMYNKPRLIDPTKKPLMLRISFENKPSQDLLILFRSLWEAEHKKPLDMTSISAKEAAIYIKKRLEVNGFEFKMKCFNPNNWSVDNLITLIDGLEAEGYEIHCLMIDYLELICKNGNKDSRPDERINLAFEKLRNHCFPRGITQIHAHQLNSASGDVLNECGSAAFAKKVNSGNFTQNSRTLVTKLDGFATMHIHELDDKYYLMLSCGKNRTASDVSIRAKNPAYMFEQYGGIVDDVNEETSKAIYSFSEMASNPVENKAPDEEW